MVNNVAFVKKKTENGEEIKYTYLRKQFKLGKNINTRRLNRDKSMKRIGLVTIFDRSGRVGGYKSYRYNDLIIIYLIQVAY